jgi:hypothetical protein
MRIYQNEHNMFTTFSKTDNNALDIDAIDNLKSLIMPKQPEMQFRYQIDKFVSYAEKQNV